MKPLRVVVCLVVHILTIRRGEMFNFDLIEPPEDSESGMTYYDKAPRMQSMSDYESSGNRNKNGYSAYNRDDEPDLSDLDQTLTKLEKWEDFEQIAEDIEKRNRGKKTVNMEQDVRELSKWLKDLKEGHVQKEATRSDILAHPFVNRQKMYGKPSAGMSMYWPEDAIEKDEPVFPNQENNGKKAADKIPIADVMKMAKQKMREAIAKRGKTPSPKQQFPMKPIRRMDDDVDHADDGIGPHGPPQKGYRRPQKGVLPPMGYTDPKPFVDKDDYSQISVDPADDGIGPHAHSQMGPSVIRPQESALPPKGGTEQRPLSHEEDYSQIGVDFADDGIGPHVRRQKRSPLPRPQAEYDSEPLPFPELEDYSQMGGDGSIPLPRQGDFSQMGSDSSMSLMSDPQKGNFHRLRSRDQMTKLQKAAFPEKPSSALRQGGLFGMDSGGMSAPQKGRLPPMLTPSRGPYPQMGNNGPMAFLQGASSQGGNAPMLAPQQGAFSQMGGRGPMPPPPQGAFPQMGGGGSMAFPQQLDAPVGAEDYMQSPYPESYNPLIANEEGHKPLANTAPGAMPEMGGNSPMRFPPKGAMPQMLGNAPMPHPTQEGWPQNGGKGPRPIPPQGGMPQNGGKGQMPFPPQGGMPQKGGKGPMPFTLQGGMPQNGGEGPMPFPPQGGMPQNGGKGPMLFPPQGDMPQNGGKGPMPFSPQGGMPQNGGEGPMPFPPQGDMPQMGENYPMSAPQQGLQKYDPYKMLPKKDDFNTPIKWVSMSSAKVDDGIAKVTDIDTGRNFNAVIDGTIFVPVIDDSIKPTIVPPTTVTTLVPRTTTENIAMRALLQFVVPEELTRNDWLGFDAALNNREKADKQCDGGGCRARCHGDTCSAGCIGIDCKSSCDGPGCLSMCIGDKCKASCNGQACDARCKGSECTTDCKSFSCVYTTNGKVKSGGGTWYQHYPELSKQYSESLPKAQPQQKLRMGPMYEEDYGMEEESE